MNPAACVVFDLLPRLPINPEPAVAGARSSTSSRSLTAICGLVLSERIVGAGGLPASHLHGLRSLVRAPPITAPRAVAPAARAASRRGASPGPSARSPLRGD